MPFLRSKLKVAAACVLLLFGCSWTCSAQVLVQSAKNEYPNLIYDAKLIRKNYCYPSFISSTVTFNDSSFVKAPINYNMLLREMHFLTEEGDTLALANGEGIARIQIDNDFYQYVPPYGFLLIFASTKKVNLSAQLMTTPRVFGTGKLYQTIVLTEDSTSRQLRDMRGNTIFVRDNHFFLVDKNNTPHKINKSSLKPNLLKLYPNHRREISQYLRKNPDSLTKTKNLITFLKYIDQLADH